MLKKIFKIAIFVIAIWVSIIAEENSVPNTMITENPDRKVTTVESLPTRDKAKLSLTVNKVVPKEIEGVYKDGTLEVYLGAETEEGKVLLKSRDIKGMSIKAYSGTSATSQMEKLNRTRDKKTLIDLFKKVEPSKEKKIEMISKDATGVKFAIRDVKEGEKVYISVMNGDKIVKSYSVSEQNIKALSEIDGGSIQILIDKRLKNIKKNGQDLENGVWVSIDGKVGELKEVEELTDLKDFSELTKLNYGSLKPAEGKIKRIVKVIMEDGEKQKINNIGNYAIFEGQGTFGGNIKIAISEVGEMKDIKSLVSGDINALPERNKFYIEFEDSTDSQLKTYIGSVTMYTYGKELQSGSATVDTSKMIEGTKYKVTDSIFENFQGESPKGVSELDRDSVVVNRIEVYEKDNPENKAVSGQNTDGELKENEVELDGIVYSWGEANEVFNKGNLFVRNKGYYSKENKTYTVKFYHVPKEQTADNEYKAELSTFDITFKARQDKKILDYTLEIDSRLNDTTVGGTYFDLNKNYYSHDGEDRGNAGPFINIIKTEEGTEKVELTKKITKVISINGKTSFNETAIVNGKNYVGIQIDGIQQIFIANGDVTIGDYLNGIGILTRPKYPKMKSETIEFLLQGEAEDEIYSGKFTLEPKEMEGQLRNRTGTINLTSKLFVGKTYKIPTENAQKVEIIDMDTETGADIYLNFVSVSNFTPNLKSAITGKNAVNLIKVKFKNGNTFTKIELEGKDITKGIEPKAINKLSGLPDDTLAVGTTEDGEMILKGLREVSFNTGLEFQFYYVDEKGAEFWVETFTIGRIENKFEEVGKVEFSIDKRFADAKSKNVIYSDGRYTESYSNSPYGIGKYTELVERGEFTGSIFNSSEKLTESEVLGVIDLDGNGLVKKGKNTHSGEEFVEFASKSGAIQNREIPLLELNKFTDRLNTLGENKDGYTFVLLRGDMKYIGDVLRKNYGRKYEGSGIIELFDFSDTTTTFNFPIINGRIREIESDNEGIGGVKVKITNLEGNLPNGLGALSSNRNKVIVNGVRITNLKIDSTSQSSVDNRTLTAKAGIYELGMDSTTGGLTFKKTEAGQQGTTEFTMEYYYMPESLKGARTVNEDVVLGSIDLIIRDTTETLNETIFTVDRRLAQISGGEWLDKDGVLRDSSGTSKGNYPDFVSITDKSSRKIEDATEKVIDVLEIDDKTELGKKETDNVSYKYLVEGNNGLALPYEKNITLGNYGVGNAPDNKFIISIKDVKPSENKKGRVTREVTEPNTTVSNNYTVRTTNQLYNGIVTEKYVGKIYSGSGRVSFEKETTGEFTFPPTYEGSGDIEVADNTGKKITMTDIVGDLPNGLGIIDNTKVLANHMTVEKANGKPTRNRATKTTSVDLDGFKFALDTANGGLKISKTQEKELEEDTVYTIKFYYNSESGNIELSTFNLTIGPAYKSFEIGTMNVNIDGRIVKVSKSWMSPTGIVQDGNTTLDYSPFIRTNVTGEIIPDITIKEVISINGEKSLTSSTVNNITYKNHSTNGVALPYGENVKLTDYKQLDSNSKVLIGIAKFEGGVNTSEKKIESKFVVEEKEDSTNPTAKPNRYTGTISNTYKFKAGDSLEDGIVSTGTIDFTNILLEGNTFTFTAGAKNPTHNVDKNNKITLMTEKSLDASGTVNTGNIANKMVVTVNNTPQILTTDDISNGIVPQAISSINEGAIALGISKDGGLIIKGIKETNIESQEITIEYYYSPTTPTKETQANDIKLGKFTFTLTNRYEDMNTIEFEVDKRFVDNRKKHVIFSGGQYTKGYSTTNNAKPYLPENNPVRYKEFVNMEKNKLDDIILKANNILKVEIGGKSIPGTNQWTYIYGGEKYVGYASDPGSSPEVALPIENKMEGRFSAIVSSGMNGHGSHNYSIIIKPENKKIEANIKVSEKGESSRNAKGELNLSNLEDTTTIFQFYPKETTGGELESTNSGTSGEKIKITNLTGRLPNPFGALSSNDNKVIANKIKITGFKINGKDKDKGVINNGNLVENVGIYRVGLDSKGNFTLQKIEEGSQGITTFTLEYFYDPPNNGGVPTGKVSNEGISLGYITLTINDIKELGTMDVSYDIRAEQLKSTNGWLAGDGTIYSNDGTTEYGDYPELVNPSYTKGETTPELTGTTKVTAVDKINDKDVTEKVIGDYKYGVSTSDKVALPYSSIKDVTLADYTTDLKNPKIVVSLNSTKEENSFVIGTEDLLKYGGKLKRTAVNEIPGKVTGTIPVNGYSGNGTVNLSSLMIDKEYTYPAGGVDGTISPITVDGKAVRNTTEGTITNNGTMVDARGLFNGNKNIATKLIIEEETTGGTQVLTLPKSRTTSSRIEPIPVTVGGIDSAIALGISADGGLIIKKLKEGELENKKVVLKYIYDTSNNTSKATTHNGIVLGTYTLTVNNDVQHVGNFTTKVDPRVLQQRTKEGVFWIHSGANIGEDPLSNLGNTSNNAIGLIKSTNNFTDVTFSAQNGILYVGDGILPPSYSAQNVFKRFTKNGKAVLGIKNDVTSIDSMMTNTGFATFKSEGITSYNIPIVMQGQTPESKKYKVDAILEYAKDSNRDIPIDGYRGSGTLRLEEAVKNTVYDFAPKGTSIKNGNVTLNITNPEGELVLIDNTMLDASNKVGESGNIANRMKITVDSESPVTVDTLTYEITQTNVDSLAGDGKVEIGINNNGGLSIKKLTNGNFDKKVKIEYFTKFTQKNNTEIEIKLGEVILHLINEVIDLGTVTYKLDGRYYGGIINASSKDTRLNTWLYPNGKTSKGLSNSANIIDYGKDNLFTYIDTGYRGSSEATVEKIIEIVDRAKEIEGNYSATVDGVNIKFKAYRPSSNDFLDETAIPVSQNGSNLSISELKKYLLGAFLNKKEGANYDNIYYIMGSDKKIYVGNIKEDIEGSQDILRGKGKIEIADSGVNQLHIFPVLQPLVENGVVSSDNGLEMEYSGDLVNGQGRIGDNTGKNIANKIVLTNINGTNNSYTVINGTTVKIENIEIGIDSATGGLTFKKLLENGAVGNSGRLTFDIEYYYDPTVTESGTGKELGNGAVKLGVFSLDVIDYFIKIEGDGVIEFGNMVYQVTTNPDGTQKKTEYFKVEKLEGKKLSFSVKNKENSMINEENTIDLGTNKVGEIPLDVKVSDHIYENQFKVEATAQLTSTTPSGKYKGTIEITVTITDENKPVK